MGGARPRVVDSASHHTNAAFSSEFDPLSKTNHTSNDSHLYQSRGQYGGDTRGHVIMRSNGSAGYNHSYGTAVVTGEGAYGGVDSYHSVRSQGGTAADTAYTESSAGSAYEMLDREMQYMLRLSDPGSSDAMIDELIQSGVDLLDLLPPEEVIDERGVRPRFSNSSSQWKFDIIAKSLAACNPVAECTCSYWDHSGKRKYDIQLCAVHHNTMSQDSGDITPEAGGSIPSIRLTGTGTGFTHRDSSRDSRDSDCDTLVGAGSLKGSGSGSVDGATSCHMDSIDSQLEDSPSVDMQSPTWPSVPPNSPFPDQQTESGQNTQIETGGNPSSYPLVENTHNSQLPTGYETGAQNTSPSAQAGDRVYNKSGEACDETGNIPTDPRASDDVTCMDMSIEMDSIAAVMITSAGEAALGKRTSILGDDSPRSGRRSVSPSPAGMDSSTISESNTQTDTDTEKGRNSTVFAEVHVDGTTLKYEDVNPVALELDHNRNSPNKHNPCSEKHVQNPVGNQHNPGNPHNNPHNNPNSKDTNPHNPSTKPLPHNPGSNPGHHKTPSDASESDTFDEQTAKRVQENFEKFLSRPPATSVEEHRKRVFKKRPSLPIEPRRGQYQKHALLQVRMQYILRRSQYKEGY